MTQHQQLQKKINGIIQPDADKLLNKGCELFAKSTGAIFTIGVDCSHIESNCIYFNSTEFPLEDFEILGQKLNLEAVLMGLGRLYGYSIKQTNNITIIEIEFKGKYFQYHLLLPPDQQPIETQKALFEIFNV